MYNYLQQASGQHNYLCYKTNLDNFLSELSLLLYTSLIKLAK